jgi:hypothetical protein
LRARGLAEEKAATAPRARARRRDGKRGHEGEEAEVASRGESHRTKASVAATTRVHCNAALQWVTVFFRARPLIL